MSDILYINDNNLLLQRANELHRSQGYAWLKNGAVHFDFDEVNSAVAACRLEPQQINSRYWQQCEQTALAGNNSGMRHAADLIWRHLSELKSRHGLSKLILVVPSHYQAANLQLLLGIAKSADLEVVGLINKAVLSIAKHEVDSDSVLHVDVQLHQTVCSEVLLKQSAWQLGKVEVIHEVGLQAMQDALLKAAQERFIQSDRFDPLHYAETEQQLFDQLPELAESIKTNGKANMVVMQAGNQHACSIDAKQWAAALEPFVTPLNSAQLGVASQQRVYDFNGFDALNIAGQGRATVGQSVTQPEYFSAKAAFDSAGHVVYQTQLPTGNVTHVAAPVTRAPTSPVNSETDAASVSAQAAATTEHATHLLHYGIATPISRTRISLENNVLAVVRSGDSNLASLLKAGQLFLMADPERTELRVNDRLGSNLADGVITVIRVE